MFACNLVSVQEDSEPHKVVRAIAELASWTTKELQGEINLAGEQALRYDTALRFSFDETYERYAKNTEKAIRTYKIISYLVRVSTPNVCVADTICQLLDAAPSASASSARRRIAMRKRYSERLFLGGKFEKSKYCFD